MSGQKFPKRMDSDNYHVWRNGVFDMIEPEGSSAIQLSWSSIKPSSITLSQSFESDSTKENHSPSNLEIVSPVSMPVLANSKIMGIHQTLDLKDSISGRKILKNTNGFCPVKGNNLEERNLDFEIEDIEREINRLSLRLESLRLEKARNNAKVQEKRGKIVAAKFKDPPKQTKIEESMFSRAKLKTPRRGLSIGPSEIIKGARRGISLGPMEIYSANKLKQLGKQDTTATTTPLPPASSRRKSCFWKLHDIDELRVAKERGKASSLSPKSRVKTASKVQTQRQVATTIVAKKAVKKDEGVLASIQPKKLFTKDIEEIATAKKPVKSGRVVPSRYNQIPNAAISARKELRKRSLPENEEDVKKSCRKRVSFAGRFQGLEQQAMRKGVNRYIGMPGEGAPMVKTIRFSDENPRDYETAIRVAGLVGKKSCFNLENGGFDDEVEELVSRGLNFTEE